jgi:hypothetical protein
MKPFYAFTIDAQKRDEATISNAVQNLTAGPVSRPTLPEQR